MKQMENNLFCSETWFW